MTPYLTWPLPSLVDRGPQSQVRGYKDSFQEIFQFVAIDIVLIAHAIISVCITFEDGGRLVPSKWCELFESLKHHVL